MKIIFIMSSPIEQEAAFGGVYQNFDRFNVKFSCVGDWYDVRTENIVTFWPECYSWTSILDTLKLARRSLYILSTEKMIKYTLVLSFQACVKA